MFAQDAQVACGMVDTIAGEIVDDVSHHEKILAAIIGLVAADHHAVEDIGNMVLDQRDAGGLVDAQAVRDGGRVGIGKFRIASVISPAFP